MAAIQILSFTWKLIHLFQLLSPFHLLRILKHHILQYEAPNNLAGANLGMGNGWSESESQSFARLLEDSAALRGCITKNRQLERENAELRRNMERLSEENQRNLASTKQLFEKEAKNMTLKICVLRSRLQESQTQIAQFELDALEIKAPNASVPNYETASLIQECNRLTNHKNALVLQIARYNRIWRKLRNQTRRFESLDLLSHSRNLL